MFTKLLGFTLGAKVMVVLMLVSFSASAGLAYMLKQSYIENGKQENLTDQWKAANDIWNTAYIELDAALLTRERERNNAWLKLADLEEQLKGVNDETGCLDAPTPIGFRRLFDEPDTPDT